MTAIKRRAFQPPSEAAEAAGATTGATTKEQTTTTTTTTTTATTNKKHKRCDDHDHGDNDDDDDDDDAVAPMMSPSAPASIQLPVEIFSLVLPYLAPRQMLRLACASPTIMKFVTLDLVVRNAIVLGGSHAASNIRHVLRSPDTAATATTTACRALVLPSPMRLLRIVNGRRCEICRTRKTNSLRLGGLFACAFCANQRTTVAFATPTMMTDKGQRRQRRQGFGKQQQCAENLHKLQMGTGSRDAATAMTASATVLKQVLEKCNGALVRSETHYCCSCCDFTCCGCGCGCSPSQCAATCQNDDTIRRRLNRVYDEADADKLVLWKEWNDRRERREKARTAKIVHAIDHVKTLVRGEHKFAMEYALSKYGTHCSLSFGVTHEVMKEIFNAPSTITKKKLTQVAAAIDLAYPTILKHGLHDFSCLSTDDPLQAAIKANLEQSYNPGHEFLRDMSFSGALKRIRCSNDAISPVLKRGFHWTFGVVPIQLRDIIALLIVGDEKDDLPFAKSICAGINKETIATTSEWLLCRRLYHLGRQEYAELKPAVSCYLQDSATQLFLKSCADNQGSHELDHLWLQAKQSVVEKIIRSPGDYEEVTLWLRSKNWALLREYHSIELLPEVHVR